jgi:hypothetical protein
LYHIDSQLQVRIERWQEMAIALLIHKKHENYGVRSLFDPSFQISPRTIRTLYAQRRDFNRQGF